MAREGVTDTVTANVNNPFSLSKGGGGLQAETKLKSSFNHAGGRRLMPSLNTVSLWPLRQIECEQIITGQ